MADMADTPPTAGTFPAMDRIHNFRGIGGLPTADGRTTTRGLLWRSGHLARATDADLARLVALGIRTVVDLRTDHDLAADGSDRVAVFRRVVDVVTDQDRWPLVWHCSAGKDRAGWVGTVVLLALGVERDAIVAHYLESNATAASQSAALLESGWMTEEVLELARPFMEVAPGYVEAQLVAVDDHWGGAGAMLRAGFGFDDQRLADLRSRLLD